MDDLTTIEQLTLGIDVQVGAIAAFCDRHPSGIADGFIASTNAAREALASSLVAFLEKE